MTDFTHLDEEGRVRMVDVGEKPVTDRRAVARGQIAMTAETFEKISRGETRKANVLETARVAAIMAAKQTASLIPMCHPIQIRQVKVEFFPDPETHTIRIEATVFAEDRTGVEMEAMTAASVAALTIYDMCKSHDRAMVISDICLLEKSGGKSGVYTRHSSESR
ncbi:MAG: cyclic pyranopterin monophosphate synthase MoaC [Thermodesulfobacteriota bacterium]